MLACKTKNKVRIVQWQHTLGVPTTRASIFCPACLIFGHHDSAARPIKLRNVSGIARLFVQYSVMDFMEPLLRRRLSTLFRLPVMMHRSSILHIAYCWLLKTECGGGVWMTGKSHNPGDYLASATAFVIVSTANREIWRSMQQAHADNATRNVRELFLSGT
jgi:hypothetical protein